MSFLYSRTDTESHVWTFLELSPAYSEDLKTRDVVFWLWNQKGNSNNHAVSYWKFLLFAFFFFFF